MHINFYATLRTAAGGKTVQIGDRGNWNLREALEAAGQSRPALQAEIWASAGQIKEHVLVFVNGRNLHFLPHGLETPLQATDTVDVFPPVGGGTKHP